MPKSRTIKIAHSPDSDDAFMFYAIKESKVDLRGLSFEFSSAEIEVLNQEVLNNKPSADIMAASFHTYALVQDKYALLDSGMSFANKDHGPKIVCKNPNFNIDDLSCIRIAIPGKHTTAFLVMQTLIETLEQSRDSRHCEGEWQRGQKEQYIFCSFDKTFDLLESGKADAALLIHEAQLKYQDYGYKLITDLGKWWHEYSGGLDLPLGCNIAPKSLGLELIQEIDRILSESISWASENFDEVMNYSKAFANNGLDDKRAKQYLETYVIKSRSASNKEIAIQKILDLI